MRLEQYGTLVSIYNGEEVFGWFRWPYHSIVVRNSFEQIAQRLIDKGIIRRIRIQLIRHGSLYDPLIADRQMSWNLLERRINDRINGVINKAELIVRATARLQQKDQYGFGRGSCRGV